ncbi:MAG TPA: hypothetical protein VIJ50_12625 [Solirubrobacteraceae bacterium]
MRILVRSAMGALCALAGCLAFGVSIAPAAATHEFLPELSEKISEGVPASSGVQFTGSLLDPAHLTVDSGRLWIDESRNNGNNNLSVVDKWDASTGGFLPPQINEEGEVTALSSGGIAVGHPGGEEQIYVGAGIRSKPVVVVYGSSGKLLPGDVWTGANTPAKEFTEGIEGIAVDHSMSLETNGDVYVATKQGAVDIFRPQAGGGEPAGIVGQLPGTPYGPLNEVTSIAVSGFNGDVVVAEGDRNRCNLRTSKCFINVFAPVLGMPGMYTFMFRISGVPQAPFGALESLAVDSGDGDIYVAESGREIVDEFDAEGKYLGQIIGAPFKRPNEVLPFKSVESVAVSPESHDVYVADFRDANGAENSVVDVFGPNRVTPDVTTEEATDNTGTGDGHIRAVLNGTVNPEKEGEASCQFVWGPTNEFGQLAACEKTVGEGVSAMPVQASLSGLPPDTTYDYRLQATNKNGTNPGEAWQTKEFTTAGPGMHDESVSSTRSESVTLDAKIDPHGKPTTYYFQYGSSAGYGTDLPAPGEEALQGAEVGSGESDIEVFQHVTGLATATLYHYRVVVVSELAPGEVETFYGPDQTFSTQTVGLPFQLPDGRAWELVSPSHKEGALLSSISRTPVQAAANGDAISDGTSVPIEAEPAGGASSPMAFFGRGTAGWSSRDISPPHIGRTEVVGGEEYKDFSEDLTTGAVQPQGSVPPLSPQASEATAYLHTNFLNDNPGELCTTNCYQPLVSPANVPAGTKFGEEGLTPDCEHDSCGGPRFVGASPDMQHVVLKSRADLTSTPSEGQGLYEWNKGTLSLVNLFPEGETNSHGGPVAESAQLGVGEDKIQHAISNDGTRVIWTMGTGENGHLYSRDTLTGVTTRLDVVQAGASGPENSEALYQTASSDGSRVFFLDQGRLTTDSTARGGRADLYEYNFNAPLGSRLTDLSVDPNEPAEVVEVLGASEDGSYVYFAAPSVLATGAVRGRCGYLEKNSLVCNLYVRHDGTTTLVAELSSEDFPQWGGGGAQVTDLPASVSHNGQWLAFMSNADLTGYDTTDVVRKQRDQEVYLYNAVANKLVCAGCNPTGARPLGLGLSLDRDEMTGLGGSYPAGSEESEGIEVASNVPVWTDQFYQSRYLSNDGRLFFDSSDALVPQDVDGTEDVYEYEPAGIGGCNTSQTTFSERSGGCVALISSGASKDESAFLDASEGGGDVFFLTTAKLLSQDVDDSPDIYDARECSATKPCFTPPPVEPPPCETGDSCKAAPSPQPTIFGSPASATFAGAGNVATPEPPAAKAKTLTRAQKLAQALKACHKQKVKKRRATCERQARSRYGAAKKSRKVKATKRGRG